MSANVIVIGKTHHNTLGIIRALGESIEHYKCILILYGEKDSYLSRSIYVSQTIYLSSADSIVNKLLSIATAERQPIIAVTDEAVHHLDLNAEALLPFFFFFMSKEVGVLSYYMDKTNQDIIAKGVGFNVPLNYTSDNISYPCILKPKASIAGGKLVLICQNDDDYKNSIARYPTTSFQIQQYLNTSQEIVLVGLSINGEVFIPAYVRKLREIAGGTTYSTVHSINELDSLLVQRSRDLITVIGYEGLFGIEFIYSEEEFWFIEVNLRCDATTYAVAVAGVNLPEAYVKAKLKEDIHNIVNTSIRSIDSMVEFRDVEFVLKGRLNLLKWLRQCKKCECRYYYNHSDKRPYRESLRVFRKRLMTRFWNRLLRR